MSDWHSALGIGAFFVGFLLMDVVVSVGLIVRPHQMRGNVPRVLGVVRRLVILKGEEPNLGSAMYGVVLVVMFKIPAIVILQPLSPYPLPCKIVSLLYLVGAGLWFVYLWRLTRRA